MYCTKLLTVPDFPRIALIFWSFSAEEMSQVFLQPDNLQLGLSDFLSDLSQAKFPCGNLRFRVDFFQRKVLF